MNSCEFICDYCSRSFTRKYNLQNHIENFHLNSPCTCHVCHQKFGTTSGYQLHMSRGHNRKGTSFPECDLCGRIFTRRQNIVSHMNTVHLQSVNSYFRCELCNKYFTTEWSLKRHSHQIHNPNYPSCNVCKKVFKQQDGLDTHMQTCHKRGLNLKQCTICDKSYANNRNLKRHIETSHLTTIEKQETFGKIEKLETLGKIQKQEVISDDNEEHSTSTDLNNSDSDDDNYVCSFCNKDFIEEKYLRQHIKTKHSFQAFYKYCRNVLLAQMKNQLPQQTEDIICKFCKVMFKNIDDFNYHMKSKHRKGSVLTCNVCYIKIYSKGAIQEHKKICKPPDRVHSCNHCSKLFTEKSSLEFHMKIFHPHTQIADSNITSTIEEISFKCSYCELIYDSHISLRKHIKLRHISEEKGPKIHSKQYSKQLFIVPDTKHICDHCNKQFESKRNIRRHIQFMHLGKQKYKCIICKSMFKEKRSLRKHIRVKHADSDVYPQCNICFVRFESKTSCNTHQNLLHSIYQCHICATSFNSDADMNNHIVAEHITSKNHVNDNLTSKNFYQCNKCNRIVIGKHNYEKHIETHVKAKIVSHCILCIKDFSSRKTLKRHLKKFHAEFDLSTLIDYCQKGIPKIDCKECLKNLNSDRNWFIYQKVKDSNAKVFKCGFCKAAYKPFEYAIQRYKTRLTKKQDRKYLKTFVRENTILSELCVTEMSDNSTDICKTNQMEAESTTVDVKMEPCEEILNEEIKLEPMSP